MDQNLGSNPTSHGTAKQFTGAGALNSIAPPLMLEVPFLLARVDALKSHPDLSLGHQQRERVAVFQVFCGTVR